jgi:hypothetical protein
MGGDAPFSVRLPASKRPPEVPIRAADGTERSTGFAQTFHAAQGLVTSGLSPSGQGLGLLDWAVRLATTRSLRGSRWSSGHGSVRRCLAPSPSCPRRTTTASQARSSRCRPSARSKKAS